ncbi:hypothetical protein [Geodermatophilus sabuli]|uniref:Uncharacterized protein n=1 Tax=Geodermatophilus sabuli TaxID=1564158 RepID=A0A285EKX5_9ACTN|nr:hypothetical protein [Geodermatophilus sabuli]MBB3084004.1 hypothetical protein [Geodermatophilus sabuli]SNX98651.1 hypothetical protein SAMN06893097_111167 [Geodermatophilus sabuli]
MTDLVTARREPGPDPGRPDQAEPAPAGPPDASGGVALARLIGLARLTPPQAVEIGVGVLARAAALAEPDAEGPGEDRVGIGPLVVTADGQVVAGSTADGGPAGAPATVGTARATAEAVLADVARAARQGARRPDPAAERLLDELDRAVAELPVAGVAAAAEVLRAAAASIDRGTVRAELGALARAAGRTAGSTYGPGPSGTPPSTRARAAPSGRATPGGPRVAVRRIGAWLLSVLVLAGVVALEVGLLRDDIAKDIGLLLDAGRSGAEPSTTPEPDGLPVVPPAPAANGAVTGVDLRLLTPCAPGTPCTLRLLVRLVPGAEPQVVTWSYRIVDRCTGAAETAPGGTVTVPPAGERAAVVGTVALPALDGVAVVAVTDSPAIAASPPVSLGSCPSAGQAG